MQRFVSVQRKKIGGADIFAKKGGSPTFWGNRKGVATEKRLGTTGLTGTL